MKVPNNPFASSVVLKSEKLLRKRINYCGKHMMKMQWVVHKCLSGSIPRLRDQRRGIRCETKQRSCYWRFLILRVSYAMRMLLTGKQLTSNSTWRSCDICVNQFTENDRKNGRMATGSCTTTMHPHTLNIFCGSFWPNMAPISCSSHHNHQILHRVTFSYSQGLRKF